ncbi:MAG TPA: 6-O-methylguanine DNA methyltransferase [Cyanobacteria bacterium UBA8803]|nr:6-O-methylguanine DNA methyltransferase [Cyanobacteria bacterium UBA9273]HBL62235.1 6-O-methylguanine DNA methyltransferase [Cyanobacteria bacterium UBA8803]
MNSAVEINLDDSETYERIAKAIAFMRQNYLHQPALATIAQHIHLSEYHFQRLFTRWVGISPKRFWQYLTLEYAKSKIAETTNLLDLTLEAGLSSPGRLHDLFVKLEAMSPGEFKTGGRGLQIRYGIHETPFGECLIATTSRGICNLHFLDATYKDRAEQMLRSEWPNADIVQEQLATQTIRDRIFAPVAGNPKPLVVFVKGTNFQIQVWRALLKVPLGGVTTYQSLAAAIGRPTAARAVGNALGSNPVAYLIPCHRVIRESGDLGGYRWGLERKAVLLGWEAISQQYPKAVQ